jgi:hypothetical protein
MKYKNNLVFVEYEKDIESLNSVVDRTLYVSKLIQTLKYDILISFSKIYVNILKGMKYGDDIHSKVILEPFV